MNYVKLIHSKLSVEEICDTVSSSSCGAISIFVGTTRDNFENKKVIQLEYEAYEPMAEKAMQQVCQNIREKWNVENIGIHHRLGIVPVKEASVVIAVSSPHRAESLEAVHYAIDTLKASVPIWKKEVYDSSKAEWKANKELESKKPPELLVNDGVVPSGINETELKEVSSEIPFVSPDLIQIKAGTKEIKRRISSFIEKKRGQIDLGNVQDFCYHGNISTGSMSCARVDALLMCRKDSKSHLRVHRVLNPWGPQTRGVDPGSINSQDAAFVQLNRDHSEFHDGGVNREPNGLEDVKPVIHSEMLYPSGIEERFKNAETHLRINGPVLPNVYSRLKQIEDRILYLEGLSPEYFKFWAGAKHNSTINFKPSRKRTYSASDLNNKLQKLEHKLSMKEIQ